MSITFGTLLTLKCDEKEVTTEVLVLTFVFKWQLSV